MWEIYEVENTCCSEQCQSRGSAEIEVEGTCTAARRTMPGCQADARHRAAKKPASGAWAAKRQKAATKRRNSSWAGNSARQYARNSRALPCPTQLLMT